MAKKRENRILLTRIVMIALFVVLCTIIMLPGTLAWFIESTVTTNVFKTKEVDVIIYENGDMVDGISFGGVIPGDDLTKQVQFGLDAEMSVVSYIRFYFEFDYNPYGKLIDTPTKAGVHGYTPTRAYEAPEYDDEAAEINANMSGLYVDITENNPCLNDGNWVTYKRQMADGSTRTYFYYKLPIDPKNEELLTVLDYLHIPEEWDNTMNYFQFSLEITVDAIQMRNFPVDFESQDENYDPWGIEGQSYIVQDLYDTRDNEYDITLRGKSQYEQSTDTTQ